MGFNKQDLRFLLEEDKGVHSFDKVLTIGNLEPEGLGKIKSIFEVFRMFSALSVNVMDYSNYENKVAVCHDLNKPIPEVLHKSYDVVFDGGTLEHVFNFPVAIANLMNLVKVEGSLFIHSVTNNFSGHGFYQFSPELFYEVLAGRCGFLLKRITIFRTGPWPKWRNIDLNLFEQGRVEFSSLFPMHILVHAKRMEDMKVNLEGIFQGNYERAWESKKEVTQKSKFAIAWDMFRNYLVFHKQL